MNTFQALHYKKYSTASDVWSFGAVMYEIWSLGHKPFEGYTNLEVLVVFAVCQSISQNVSRLASW